MSEDRAVAAPHRRILFIEKPFQLRFILKMTLLAAAGTAVTGVLLYALADREFGRAFYSAHYQARNSWELLLPAVLVSAFLGMCLVAGLAGVMTLYDSHRIGGPLYRFQANLRAVGQGDLTLVTRLRQGDELQSLTGAMNEMTEALRDKVASVRAAADRVEAAVAAGAGGDPARQAAVQAAAAGLREALQRFRLDR